MKWRVRKPGARRRAVHQWHRWFAWRPVRVPTSGRMSNMTVVWLEFMWRKGTYICWFEGAYWQWEYKQ